jgi:ABC-type transport system involved in cytochrome bd biosynthesis fused ATPase/permease subunit
MSSLNIRVDGASEETKRRAVEALSTAGISVARAWLDEEPTDAVPSGSAATAASGQADEQPHKWAMWVSIALFVAVPVLIISWIWSGDWRFGVTAVVVLPLAFLFLGLSLE